MTPAIQQLLFRLGIALALGLLIGLERGWEGRELAEGRRAAGFRTFGIISLLGGVSELLAENGDWMLMPALVIALGTFMSLGYWRTSAADNDLSVTTAVTALLTFALGAVAVRGHLVVASSATVVVVLILSIKPELHEMVRHIERSELLATIRLLLISVVLLPILPDRDYGPWHAVNPYRIWWMVVLVAVVSYVGYYAIRLMGNRLGVLVTGVFGGLVSSTATSVELAQQGRELPAQRSLLAAGVVVSSAVMFPRMLAIAAIANPDLVLPLIWPLIAAGAAAFAIGAWWLWRPQRANADQRNAVSSSQQASAGMSLATQSVHGGPGSAETPGDAASVGAGARLQSRNPLDLKAAITFGLVLTVIMILSRAAVAWFGSSGIYLLSAISGLADVDAITLSLASMNQQRLITAGVAVLGVSIAAAVNTVTKAVIVYALAGYRMALPVAGAFAVALLAGAVTLRLTMFN